MKSLSVIIFVVIGLSIFSYAEVWGADWKLFFTAEGGNTFYYDPESITHPSKDIVRVWNEVFPSEKGVLTIHGEVVAYSYLKTLLEIHCGEKKYRHLSGVFYSQDDRVLSRFDLKEPDWKFIVPESYETNVEKLYKIVCSNSK